MPLSSRTSLDNILAASSVEVAEQLLETGFLSGVAGSCKCRGRKKPARVLENQGCGCLWRCKTCRKVISITRTDKDEDLFGGARPALRSIASALWLYASNLHVSSDQASSILGIDHKAVRALFERFNNVFTPLIDKLNSCLTTGGRGMDVELDEIAFRSVERGDGVVWLRYLAVVRRGSSLVKLERLPYRVTAGGQSGGGPTSVAELRDHLRLPSDEPVLSKGSVCHTDNVKACTWLESSLNDGTLVQNDFQLAHTCVKHKPPHPEFTKRFQVQVWTGEAFEKQIREHPKI